MQNLLQTLNHLHPLSTAETDRLVQVVQKYHFPKGHLLQTPGSVCQHLYFLESGFGRAYYYQDDREITGWFWSEEDFVTSADSFWSRKPAREYNELLEDAVLYGLSYEDLQAMYRDFPSFNIIGRLLAEHYFTLAGDSIYSLRTKTARERYENLLELHPQLLQRASLGQIASYLSITPETLSRIRKQIF